MPGQEITENQGVVSVSTSDQDNGRKGHSTLFFEYWDTNTQSPKSLFTDLRLQNNSNSKIEIRTVDGDEQHAEDFANLSNKRSWVTSNNQLEAGIDKAKDIKANASDYTFAFMGFGLTKKKPINCARFAEKVLKAAGIKATSGLIIKTPYELATGSKTKKKKKKTKEKEPENIDAQEALPLPDVIQEINIAFISIYQDDQGQLGQEAGLARPGTRIGVTDVETVQGGTTYRLVLEGTKRIWVKLHELEQFLPNADPIHENGDAEVANGE